MATETGITWMEMEKDDFLVMALDNATLGALSRPLVDAWKIVIKT